ncbi:NAD(P)H-dependent flavin oxidoreductase [Burkholderia vietnamiensis]|uniref:NAD(P)H-dependent flavin oxidoreductase n=1 Tax=Burkholderia vietnamiensis TaxID=60552 RepID=UPI001CB2C3BD|nr:putative Nitronate monooxygenase [Burkholderia vietnamiensis]
MNKTITMLAALVASATIAGCADTATQHRNATAGGAVPIAVPSGAANACQADAAPDDALIGTFALVPQLVDATGLPVLAAGGIMDGRGIAAALALGAQAAQLGTAFLTCTESAIAPDWKARVRASADTSTQVTRAITGRHARGLRNTLMVRLGEHVAEVPPYPVQNALTQPLRQAAARANDGDYLSLWAGQGAPLTRRRDAALSAAQLVDALDAEWRAMAA